MESLKIDPSWLNLNGIICNNNHLTTHITLYGYESSEVDSIWIESFEVLAIFVTI